MIQSHLDSVVDYVVCIFGSAIPASVREVNVILMGFSARGPRLLAVVVD